MTNWAYTGSGLSGAAGTNLYNRQTSYPQYHSQSPAAYTPRTWSTAPGAMGPPNPYTNPQAQKPFTLATLGTLYDQALKAQYGGYFGELNQGVRLAEDETALNARDRARQLAGTRKDIGFDLADIAQRQRGVGFDRARQLLEPGFINREHGLSGREALNAQLKAVDRYGTQMLDLVSDVEARGGVGSTLGARGAHADITKELARTGEDIKIFKGRAGLKREMSLADHTRAMGQLDVEAKRLGIAGDKLRAGLDQAIQAAGLGGELDALTLMKAKNSASVEKAKAGSEVLEWLLGETKKAGLW